MNTTEVPLRAGKTRSFVPGRFHNIAYVDWGCPDSLHVVICVHCLSRQGRDFDPLAQALACLGCRVICPDLAGRGRSVWLKDPETFGLPQYTFDMAVLIAHLGVARAHWIGTSLGGLIGMVIAGAQGSPIRCVIINDIGPFLPWAPVRALGDLLREAPQLHASLDTAEQRLREVHAPFGSLIDAQWRHLTEHSFVPDPKCGWRPHFDPSIGDAFGLGRVYNVGMRRDWDAITCPVCCCVVRYPIFCRPTRPTR
jgi:pimeloyl-ACP methyl ester carboxylesterase